MDISIAKVILKAATSLDGELGKIDMVVSKIDNKDERNIWITRLGNAIRAINEELIVPIETEFPELGVS